MCALNMVSVVSRYAYLYYHQRLTEYLDRLVSQVVFRSDPTQIRNLERVGDLVKADHLRRRKLSRRLHNECVTLVAQLRIVTRLIMRHAVDEGLSTHPD